MFHWHFAEFPAFCHIKIEHLTSYWCHWWSYKYNYHSQHLKKNSNCSWKWTYITYYVTIRWRSYRSLTSFTPKSLQVIGTPFYVMSFMEAMKLRGIATRKSWCFLWFKAGQGCQYNIRLWHRKETRVLDDWIIFINQGDQLLWLDY